MHISEKIEILKHTSNEQESIILQQEIKVLLKSNKQYINDFKLAVMESMKLQKKDYGQVKYKQTLQETVGLLQNAIDQSNQQNAVLDDSSSIVKSTDIKYDGISGYMQISRTILNDLKKKDKTDLALLFSGLAVFIFTCCYIVIKRMFW
ncbi:hypothetical protein HDV06_003515 [Boothiomyces sp. JEL0866]|nr:hypothetical protein HDV06_003483 [Boothiomyces sp. JEL0866]KAJ3325745.1 hypothetical protein HDV06_003515 [Boothiomyces sp. JEL0866]